MAAMTFEVPTLVDQNAAEEITEEILVHESDAKVDVDLSAKTVNVDTEASRASIRQMIVALGHTVNE